MEPLIEPYRRQFRDMLEEKMPSEGAEAVLAALPASEADMPATKDFVRAEITEVRAEIKDLRAETTSQVKDLRAEMIERFAAASTETRRWIIVTGIALVSSGIAFTGVIVAAINTLPS